MFEQIKQSSLKVRWNLCEVHKITEWKDGCVYRTKSLGIISCSPEYGKYLKTISPNIIVGPVSTKITREIG